MTNDNLNFGVVSARRVSTTLEVLPDYLPNKAKLEKIKHIIAEQVKEIWKEEQNWEDLTEAILDIQEILNG